MEWVKGLIQAVGQFEWGVIHLIGLAAVALCVGFFVYQAFEELRAVVRRWRWRRRPIRHVQERWHVETSGYSDPAFRPALGGRPVARQRMGGGPARRVDQRATSVPDRRAVDGAVRVPHHAGREAGAGRADVGALPGRVPRQPQGAA